MPAFSSLKQRKDSPVWQTDVNQFKSNKDEFI